MTTAKFKNTEIGRIPEDWEVKELGTSALIKARIGWQGLTTQEYLDAGEYYLITGTDFKDGKINWSGCHFVTKERYDQDKFIQIKKQDVLVSKDGTIGKVAYLDEIPGKGTLNSGVFVIRSKDSKITQPFLAIVFLSKYFDNFIDKILAGSTIVHLYQKDIVNFTFPVPPTKEEQSRIATALFDIDTLIRDLDRTIEKKQNIRQGAMEQFLSGKKRLPGFKGEWLEMKVSEIGKLSGAGVDKKSNPGEVPVRLVNFLDVYHRNRIAQCELHHWVTATPEKVLSCNVKRGDVFFTPSSEMPDDIGQSAVAVDDMENVCYSYHIYRLRPSITLDPDYGAYAFQNKYFFDQVKVESEGSGKRYVVSINKFKELYALLPPTLEEQRAIAATLTAMDDEIAVLQMERDKYANIRSGMMDDLLTGTKRL